MKTNIPIYRAKKIDSDEYAEGLLVTGKHIKIRDKIYTDEIDQSTLAIHFSDMLDSEGKKIFASLSEDGKGGDTISELKSIGVVVILRARAYILWSKNNDFFSKDLCNHQEYSKVTGIQK